MTLVAEWVNLVEESEESKLTFGSDLHKLMIAQHYSLKTCLFKPIRRWLSL